MFDVYEIHSPKSATANINVTEKPAPTDESLKLLREMEQKVLADLLGQVKLQHNGFEVVAYAFKDYRNFAKQVYLKYTLGTREFELKITLRVDATIREMVNKLVDELSRDLAKNILEQALNANVVKELMGGV